MKLARLSLYVMAIVFLGLGGMSLVVPTILTPLVEISTPTPIAVMEICHGKHSTRSGSPRLRIVIGQPNLNNPIESSTALFS
jgi:hypothetical protein